jgi:hypothetical protein
VGAKEFKVRILFTLRGGASGHLHPLIPLAQVAPDRGDEEERWDELRTHVRPHAAHVVGEIERLATRGV